MKTLRVLLILMITGAVVSIGLVVCKHIPKKMSKKEVTKISVEVEKTDTKPEKIKIKKVKKTRKHIHFKDMEVYTIDIRANMKMRDKIFIRTLCIENYMWLLTYRYDKVGNDFELEMDQMMDTVNYPVKCNN